MKERFMLKALGLLLIVLSAETVTEWVLALFEGRVGFDANLLVLLIGIGLFYAHPLWHKAARVYVVLCGLAIIVVAVMAFGGFPDVRSWLELEHGTLESIPPPLIALYAAVLLALLVWSYVFLHKAAVADKDPEESESSG
ncbi:MAG: hypothetical protein F4Y00_08155 [Bacteroidetes bacterium SB0662_bin_6]|nr:hypothetical protein [Bacteroidetes bacterium SB0668_bin_1]MYE04926.1 hypothetical protein [Bacteroidetes bacterium SB0662_bin_6]